MYTTPELFYSAHTHTDVQVCRNEYISLDVFATLLSLVRYTTVYTISTSYKSCPLRPVPHARQLQIAS